MAHILTIYTTILYLQNFTDYLRSRTALNWLVDIFAAFTLFIFLAKNVHIEHSLAFGEP